MLTLHNHEPGLFDAGHCWACARQAGLLDYYRRVQREEARLQETREWAGTARRFAIASTVTGFTKRSTLTRTLQARDVDLPEAFWAEIDALVPQPEEWLDNNAPIVW